jgi:hypothetical protein
MEKKDRIVIKKRSIVTILFPALFMTIITIVSFSNMLNFNGIDFKGIFIVSLIALFPLLFLIQGILSALNNINVLLSMGISVLSFILLMIVYLNESAFIYILTYLVFGVLGYMITYIIMKIKSAKNN